MVIPSLGHKKMYIFKIITKCSTNLLQSGTAFGVLQSGTILLQSGTAFFITKWDGFITKWDGYYKVGRFYYKVGRVLQSGTIITKWALTYHLMFQEVSQVSFSSIQNFFKFFYVLLGTFIT